MLPGMDGYQVLEGVRARKQTPVLMLAARGSVDERVKGLRLGADDYLPKLLYQAFNVTEALAFAVLKRSLAYRRAVKKVIMPAQGPQQNVDSLFHVAKCINQQRKSRRMLLTAGIVKVISGKSWTPLL